METTEDSSVEMMEILNQFAHRKKLKWLRIDNERCDEWDAG